MRIALGIEYDGRDYFGWQSQAQGHTVQDVLQQALSRIAASPVSVIAAGRTDTGVHALEQVVHFDVSCERPLSAWVRGVNACLPRSVAVLWARVVDDQFHARFSAVARRYQYVLLNRAVRPAWQHGQIGWCHAPLALEPMQEAAQCVLGEHDFSSFRAAECQAKSPVKCLTQLAIVQYGDTFVFSLSANAFLHHMVRNLIGCLLVVGRGQQPAVWMETVLQARSRREAAPTFMPDGLYLREVEYDARWQLPRMHRSVREFALD